MSQGFQVLSLAKLRILELIYHCIKPNLDPRTYKIFCCQTDSISFMLTVDSPEQWLGTKYVIPGREEEWNKMQREFLVDHSGLDPTRNKFKAGLFKIEWKGRNCIALSCKVYYVEGDKGIRTKIALRGIPKSATEEYNFATFRDVLCNKESKGVYADVRGFDYWRGAMYLMSMKKRAFIPNFIKRKVYGPHFTTKTLDITPEIIPEKLINEL